MRAYSLYICDRSKVCLFHRDWTSQAQQDTQAYNKFITLYGMVFQMKLFTAAADPTKPIGDEPGSKPDGMRLLPIGQGTGFRCARPAPCRPQCAPCTWACGLGQQEPEAIT